MPVSATCQTLVATHTCVLYAWAICAQSWTRVRSWWQCRKLAHLVVYRLCEHQGSTIMRHGLRRPDLALPTDDVADGRGAHAKQLRHCPLGAIRGFVGGKKSTTHVMGIRSHEA